MTKKMLIFTPSGGRLGNQLISYIHLLSFWQENQSQFDMINLSFWPYSPLLNGQGSQKYCFHSNSRSRHLFFAFLFFMYTHLPKRYQHKCLSLFTIIFHGFAFFWPGFNSLFANKNSIQKHIMPFCLGKNYDFLDLSHTKTHFLLSKKHTVFTGFQIKSWKLVLKHKQATMPLLKPHIQLQNKATSFMTPIRQKYKTVIGVHIRQGDWRRHPKSITDTGRIAFDATTYVSYMKQLTSLLGSNIGFILTSDEEQDMSLFSEFNVHLCTGSMGQDGHFFESILELSQCDYLLMPDTTFAGWASFINDVPMFVVRSETDTLYADKFSKIKDITGFC